MGLPQSVLHPRPVCTPGRRRRRWLTQGARSMSALSTKERQVPCQGARLRQLSAAPAPLWACSRINLLALGLLKKPVKELVHLQPPCAPPTAPHPAGAAPPEVVRRGRREAGGIPGGAEEFQRGPCAQDRGTDQGCKGQGTSCMACPWACHPLPAHCWLRAPVWRR